MPVTTWATGKKNPLLLFPAVEMLPFNWSHENEWGTAGDSYTWGAEIGTPSRDSTHAYFGSWGAKFTGSTTQSAICRMPYLSTSWGAVDGYPYAAYAWIYPTAYTGAAAVRIQLDLTKSGGVALTTPSEAYADFAISTMTLNAWNLVRVATVGLTAAQQAEFVNVDYRIALIPNSGTATFWVDGCFFGRALDGQDIGINNDGAWAVTPYPPRKVYNTATDRIANGIQDGKAFNAGFFRGRFDWNNMRDADRAAYRRFIDLCSDKTPFTLLHDQSTNARDYYPLSVLSGNAYGEKQFDGNPNWSAGFDFESIPSLSAVDILEEIMIGLFAARPAASSMSGKFYYATDTRQLYESDGTTWYIASAGYSGTYASRPAADSGNSGVIYTATDIGVSGCRFRSTGSAWVQDGACLLLANTSNVVINSTTETSVFNSTPSIPNGSVAVGTFFKIGYKGYITGGGASSATLVNNLYVGSNNVGTHAAWALGGLAWNNIAFEFDAEIVIRTLGSGTSGKVMATGIFTDDNSNYYQGVRIRSNTAANQDTTGDVKPDAKVVLASLVNSPVFTVDNAYIIAYGLA